ncbi:MAG: glycosyltransferase [Eubacterium sp.]|nr:glycosyltransferase [Eubacterium sp.]
MIKPEEFLAKAALLAPAVKSFAETEKAMESPDILDESTLVLLTEDFFAEGNHPEEKLARFAAAKAPVLTVTVPPVDSEQLYLLLSGRMKERLDIHGITGFGIIEMMKKAGYTLQADWSEGKEYTGTSDGNPFTSKGSLVNEYLRWLTQYTASGTDKSRNIYFFMPETAAAAENETIASPFLSVIVRTTGSRNESLQEALLSLCSQKDMDYEILLIGHNVKEEYRKPLEDLIAVQPSFLKERIRFFFLDGGTRTAPLNFGFAHARGLYTAVLDDDDFVFENWVSAFHETAQEHPGAIIHSKVLMQNWERLTDSEGKEFLRASGPFDPYYSMDFDWCLQMFNNLCPFNGLAFPTACFRDFGIRFNEEFNTTEDWDFLQRTAAVCGVADSGQTTCVYRLWTNAATSHVQHNMDEWDDNYIKIIESFYERPLLFPASKSEGIVRLIGINPEAFRYHNPEELAQPDVSSKLYFSGPAGGFSEETAVTLDNKSIFPAFCYTFENLEGKGNVTTLRWDPTDRDTAWLSNIVFTITFKDGSSRDIDVAECETNGFWNGGRLVFYTEDPQILIPLPDNSILCSVSVSGQIRFSYPPDILKIFTDSYAAAHPKQEKKKGFRGLFHK